MSHRYRQNQARKGLSEHLSRYDGVPVDSDVFYELSSGKCHRCDSYLDVTIEGGMTLLSCPKCLQDMRAQHRAERSGAKDTA